MAAPHYPTNAGQLQRDEAIMIDAEQEPDSLTNPPASS
jgi:hypothetical protein